MSASDDWNTERVRMSKKISLFIGMMLLSARVCAADDALVVRRMVPEGTNIRQADKIVLEFSRPVAALGDMARADVPVKIKPRLNCRWRWLNQSSLACVLDEKDGLRPAESYRVTVKPEFQALTGEKMIKEQVFTLETVRPEVDPDRTRFVRFVAPERPQWRVAFNTGARKKSVRSAVYFKADGKKIKADVTDDECHEWEKDCQAKYLVAPAVDLGTDQAYELVYESGIKSENGGSLRSLNAGVAGKGRTPPVFQAKALQCYDDRYDTRSFTAEQTRLNPPECRFDAPVNIVLSDKTVLGGISGFVKGSPAVTVNNRETVSEYVSVFAPKAGQSYAVTVSDDLTDVWGNRIERPATFYFRSGDRRPELNLPYTSAVLEAGEKTAAVGYATNLEKARAVYTGFNAAGALSGARDVRDISPAVKNLSYPFEYGARAMLEGRSGFVTGRFQTVPALDGRYFFAVSVSPWQAVAKIGWGSSLVWAADMQTGEPVAGAKVELFAAPMENPMKLKILAVSETDGTGRAALDGYEKFDPAAERLNQWDNAKDSLFVRVVKGDDVAVLPLRGGFDLSAGALSDWRVSSVYYPEPNRYLRAFGFTPQGVYRAGDEVAFKLYVRRIDGERLGAAPADGWTVGVTDAAGNSVYERKNVALSDFGTADGRFTLSPQSVSGWYDIVLKRGEDTLYPARFLVSDFSAAAYKVATDINGKVFRSGGKVRVGGRATLFSGGAFTRAKTRQSAVLNWAPFSIETKDGEEPFSFDPDLDQSGYAPETLFDVTGETDEKGEVEKTVTLKKSVKPYGKIRFETRVFDDSGRTVSSFATAEYFGTERLVGVRRAAGNAKAGQPAGVEYVVSDTRKNLVAGVPVSVSFYKTVNRLVREKSAGSAYLMKYVTRQEKVGECMGMSAVEPQKCLFTPESAGYYKAVASINGYTAKTGFYVEGADYVPWAGAENRLNVTADKKEYKTGDTIVLTVENPAVHTRALVTVERYGVLQSFVKTFEKSVEKIEIPVTDDFFPGVYVAISAFSPRVEQPADQTPDLGKPAQWTGYLNIPVADDSRRVKVEITPEKTDYRPAQTLKARVKTTLPDNRRAPVEIAVVVVDESVLDLLPDGDGMFDPYAGLNRLGDLDVRTYSLVEQLIGRQKIEKKGANQGGDGGADFAVRDVFKFVAYFNPSLKTDENGEAVFETKLPDNLTGWRIVAVAVTPDDLAGAGKSRVTVTQPLEIRPLLPNQVRAGDTFSAGVSVLNRTARNVTARLTMTASGAAARDAAVQGSVDLKPFERKSFFFDPVQAKLNPSDASGAIDLRFAADNGTDRDGARLTVPVLNLTTMETAALHGGAAAGNIDIPLDVPAGVKEYGGTLDVSVSAGVLDGAKRAVAALRDYPHPCWEQKLSRAAAAAVYARRKNAFAGEDVWPDADGFVRETMKQAAAYQTDGGAMAYFGRSGAGSPYLSAYTADVFDFLQNAGYAVDPAVAEKLADYLTGLFKRTDAAADPAQTLTARLLSAGFLKNRGRITDADIAVFDQSVPSMTAFDRALYLRLKPRDAALFDGLMNMSYQTSGSLIFKEPEETDAALLPSAAKTTCAALRAVAGTDGETADKLMRGAYTLRRKDGTWANTQADAFCLAALQAYAAAQPEKINLDVMAAVGGESLLAASFQSPADPAVSARRVLGADRAGEHTALALTALGDGRYYYSVRLSHPSDMTAGVNAGFEIGRRVFVERKGAFVPVTKDVVLKRGERVKVELTVKSPVDHYMAALRDPVAGAFEPVNALLATSSDAGETDGVFDFTDITRAAAGFYAGRLPAGTHTASYMAQVVSDGTFTAFPAKVEAMYTPDVFGLTAADVFVVAP